MSNRKWVLIIVENSYPPLDVRVWNEATTLRDAGWQVSVICPAPERTQHIGGEPRSTEKIQRMDGVTLYRFPITFAEHGVFSFFREYLSAFISIARLSWDVWRNTPFDIIHFCNPPDIFFPISLFFRFLGARVVFDHHDLLPEAILSRYTGATRRLLYAAVRTAEYMTFRTANVVISTNESYRQIAMERGGISEEQVYVVRNGPKIDDFKPVEPDLALKRKFHYLACYVGVMGHEDGIPELISAIRYVIHDLGRKDIGFTLIGDGAMRSQALSDLKTWGLESFVEMPGMILDNLVLRSYLSAADVCLSPEPLNPLNAKSTFIKIGEYMAMGKPIVAFDLDETRHTAGEAAIYIEPGNIPQFGKAIVTLIESPHTCQRMGGIGRRRFLDHFAWDHQEPHLLRAYEIANTRDENIR
jgi:glycosyltransferase involved in cell wall biosynthesis